MSLRAAINAKCRECVYDPKAGGTWRAQVQACSCADCPLWTHRPRTLAAGTPRQRLVQDSAELTSKRTREAA